MQDDLSSERDLAAVFDEPTLFSRTQGACHVPAAGGVHKSTDTVVRSLYYWSERTILMLSTLVLVLVVLWLLGVVTSYTLGGLIHILLVVALAVVLLRIIQGRHPIAG